MTEMTEREIRAVYALATTYDNRKTSEANVTAWWEQARRNRWTFDEAREAIHEHHRHSTEFLMPAHVTAIIRANRRQPEHIDNVRQLPAAPAAQPERIRSIVGEIARRLHWKRPPYNPALDVECPYCHAAPKRPCARLVTRGPHRGQYVPLSTPHPSRVERAKEAS